MHLLPMVLVPCITMMTVGLVVLFNPSDAIVTDVLVQRGPLDANAVTLPVPLALFLPALLFPVVVIPYIAFCMTLGVLWSMRSKGTVGAIITTLILVCIVTGGLSMCLVPIRNIELLGAIFGSLSPISNVFATLTPAQTLPSVLQNGYFAANIGMGFASIVSGVIWSLVCLGLLRSMSSSFVTTVRRLAGIN